MIPKEIDGEKFALRKVRNLRILTILMQFFYSVRS